MIFDGVTRKQAVTLATTVADPAISIYFPTASGGPQVQQGRIRLKNLLNEAENRLVSRGLRTTTALNILASARVLDSDVEFWISRLDGLAIFISPSLYEVHTLPFEVPEFVQVGSHFQVRPLLRMLNKCQAWYVLALEKSNVRLIRCAMRGANGIEVPEMPTSLEQFLLSDNPELQLQMQAARRPTLGHGPSDKSNIERERVRRFCSAITHGLEQHLASSRDPIVLFGTEEMQHAFREVSNLRHLLPNGITRCPKLHDPSDLRAETTPLMREYADRSRGQAIEHYNDMAGTGLTSQQIEEILPAARQGKIDVLFTYRDSRIWGVPHGAGRPELHSTLQEGDEELINEAAIAVLENSGTVFEVTPHELRLTGPAAAIYRY